MLSAGTRLGPYEILSPIGAGGMGEVFKARDTRLDRTVAIKTSVQQFSERFDREARAIAALNHPHICQLYDVGPDYLVMEYLDGAPLRGPLPLEKVLEYARQICDALDAAHRKGITHRDLKPANILLTRTGVKLLDFGLAKMARRPVTGDETLTQALTGQNTIVGTLSYMSPEQVQGKDTDARSDIFSFGVVLYEMLTGKRAFDGDNPASVISSIMLKEPPPVSGVAPPSLERILQRCLKKDPEERWQNARDLMFELSAIAEPTAATKRRNWLGYAATALLAITATLAISHLLPHDTASPTSDWKLSLTPPPGSDLFEIGNLGFSTPEISPDGSMVVMRIGDSFSLRRLNSTGWAPLRGTEGGEYVFWSPDSRSIAFFNGSRLMKMRIPDGAPEIIRDSPFYIRGGDWGSRDQTLTAENGLRIGLANGGSPIRLRPDSDSQGPFQPSWPHFLPDGEHFIFSGYDPKSPEGPTEGRGIYLAAWRDGQWKLRPVRLKANSNEGRYSPAHGGCLLFVQSDNLYAQRLNISQARLEGEPELVIQGVGTSAMFGNSHFSSSTRGTLAWRPGKAALAQLTWFDRQGKVLEFAGPPDAWDRVKLSPDERRIAANVQHAGVNEIRILEVNKSGAQRLPSSPAKLIGNCCLWFPDSDRLLYTEREFIRGPAPDILMQQSAAGGGIRELGPAPDRFLEGLSADGKQLLVWGTEKFLQIAPFPPNGSSPRRVTASGGEGQGAISPDGKWVAYRDQREIFVQPLTSSAPRRQISLSGGYMLVWRADGKEILYLSVQDRQIWSVSVDLARGEFGAATPLFRVRLPSMISQSSLLAVTRDGSRILFAQAVEQPESNQINIAGDASQVNKSR